MLSSASSSADTQGGLSPTRSTDPTVSATTASSEMLSSASSSADTQGGLSPTRSTDPTVSATTASSEMLSSASSSADTQGGLSPTRGDDFGIFIDRHSRRPQFNEVDRFYRIHHGRRVGGDFDTYFGYTVLVAAYNCFLLSCYYRIFSIILRLFIAHTLLTYLYRFIIDNLPRLVRFNLPIGNVSIVARFVICTGNDDSRVSNIGCFIVYIGDDDGNADCASVSDWEPVYKPPPCDAGEQEYDGHCFVVALVESDFIAFWTYEGFTTTAILYGTPSWARGNRPCQAGIYCVPDNAADFGRFAGMLAQRFNGLNGYGRIADFVIDKEVGNINYFDIGCGSPPLAPCDKVEWIDLIAANYNAAYDAIFAEQWTARIMTSIDNKFGLALENVLAGQLAGMTVLLGLANKIGGRQWRVSINAYNKPGESGYSYNDFPYVTLGNIGILVGWLRQQFPSATQLRTLQLTEQGFPGSPLLYAAQADNLCNAFRNVLGTPGIDSYIYYHIKDTEGSDLGLYLSDESFAKPSWSIWALSNIPGTMGCGFQYLPFVILTLGRNSNLYIASTRKLPAGYTNFQAWYMYHSEQPGTVMLYECAFGQGSLLTTDSTCNLELPYGPVGWIYTSQVPNSVPLYSCYNPDLTMRYPWGESNCGGFPNAVLLGVLGYVFNAD
ncbi:subtilisin-like serine protease [Drechmeria coniospora]|uniref:Subtilisin-like serine protease n=1 Tax=Drechmeria coniospora TaxID=98403 RepID=A0A151GAB1_DRECN|nr:subtilisin-like serine protease [Drechmeria coniospora]KYK54020.1 subtilisin-like serine protease [Drechmeria coniospora]